MTPYSVKSGATTTRLISPPTLVPDDIARIMEPLCGALWEQGRSFGTIGGVLRDNGVKAEVTTFRSEEYVDHSRKPAVTWGDSLEADLSRRDFTINALALDVIALDAQTPGVQTLFRLLQWI